MKKNGNQKFITKKDIPNILTLFRFILIPVFIFVFFSDIEHATWIAMVVFLTAGLTDVIDGYLARKYNWVSDLGKMMDPFADKMMVCTVLVCLCIEKLVPIWAVALIIAKEMFMLISGLIIFKRKDTVVVSSWAGKSAVCLIYAVIATVMLSHTNIIEIHKTVIYALCLLAVLAAFAALAIYSAAYAKSQKSDSQTKKEV